MLFNNFELEDLYNSYEKAYSFSFSTACLNPLSIHRVLSLYEEKDQEFLLKDLLNLELDYSSKYGLEEFYSALEHIYNPQKGENAESGVAQRSLKDYEQSPFETYKQHSKLQFLSSCGAAEAIILLFSSLFTLGDSLIVQKPIYPSLYKIPEGLGCKVIDWDFKWAEDFKLNLKSLKKTIKENPEVKALVINNPNNPCGYCFNEFELKELINILNGRYLIADEVFRDICLNLPPPVASIYEKGISISDVSKSYGLQGLRVGWIATQDEKIIEKCLSQKSYFSLRTSILSEKIAALALNKKELLLENSKILIKRGLDKIYENPYVIKLTHNETACKHTSSSNENTEIEDHKQSQASFSGEASIDLPQGSFGGLCMLAKFNSNKNNLRPSVNGKSFMQVEDFFQELIERGIFILPGKVFGIEYSEYFRLSVLRIP
ncbi:MAG: aminotransferase class I/II-fold pyridoxal phosphate-dependent enzyme [Cyanobacteria bacterium REEB446]|nr:aminotransferase class I/II-fold pyridoxal phosphate-dependent enzyme [Cyanobacteria bacterium REEB446]